ncbi:MAG: EthD family reductase [Jatrophihabitantaceae bacterium]
MGAKLVVLYGKPADAEAFDAHYRDVHAPLVEKIPGLERWSSAKFVGAADGGEVPFHQIVELHFADADSVQAAFGSEEGKAAAADYGGIAPEGSRMFIAVSD